MARQRSAQYRPDPKAVNEFLTSEETFDLLQASADDVLDEAKAIAKVVAYDTGAYHDSLKTERVITDRAVVRVRADISYGLVVESIEAVLALALLRSRGD